MHKSFRVASFAYRVCLKSPWFRWRPWQSRVCMHFRNFFDSNKTFDEQRQWFVLTEVWWSSRSRLVTLLLGSVMWDCLARLKMHEIDEGSTVTNIPACGQQATRTAHSPKHASDTTLSSSLFDLYTSRIVSDSLCDCPISHFATSTRLLCSITLV